MNLQNKKIVGIKSIIIKVAKEIKQENMTMDVPKVKSPKQISETKYNPGMRSKRYMKRINEFAQNRKMVNIRYKDSSGNISNRLVEPYEIKGEDFWGYDPEKQGIRRFKLDNLKKVKGTDVDFSPKWEVKTARVGMRRFIEKLAGDIQ